jgi:hypothetical protein
MIIIGNLTVTNPQKILRHPVTSAISNINYRWKLLVRAISSGCGRTAAGQNTGFCT